MSLNTKSVIFGLLFLTGCSSTSTMDSSSGHKSHQYSDRLEQVYSAASEAVAKQGWSIVSSDATAGRISAKTGMNLLTWGDDITVLVRQTAPNVVKVDVGSQTNMQLIPSGLSESNIENFYNTLDKLAHRIN